mmetsp:Transcript_175350/g.562488  ORF Transcript_175350/g.562488 Transcript_175350/m.562488 type:complete len:425 (+) Transcript_175350:130-1404(+)
MRLRSRIARTSYSLKTPNKGRPQADGCRGTWKRHIGQVSAVRSQASQHCRCNLCPQGIVRISSPASEVSRHTGQQFSSTPQRVLRGQCWSISSADRPTGPAPPLVRWRPSAISNVSRSTPTRSCKKLGSIRIEDPPMVKPPPGPMVWIAPMPGPLPETPTNIIRLPGLRGPPITKIISMFVADPIVRATTSAISLGIGRPSKPEVCCAGAGALRERPKVEESPREGPWMCLRISVQKQSLTMSSLAVIACWSVPCRLAPMMPVAFSRKLALTSSGRAQRPSRPNSLMARPLASSNSRTPKTASTRECTSCWEPSSPPTAPAKNGAMSANKLLGEVASANPVRPDAAGHACDGIRTWPCEAPRNRDARAAEAPPAAAGCATALVPSSPADDCTCVAGPGFGPRWPEAPGAERTIGHWFRNTRICK